MTPKQCRFVEEYLVDLNATAAAERVGYKSASKMGPRLVGKSSIQAAIQEAQAERAVRVQITADFVLRRLKDEAENLDNPAPARVQALIALGKHLALFTERVQIEQRKRLEVTIRVVDARSVRDAALPDVSRGCPVE
jgi:phage terminase small subunit